MKIVLVGPAHPYRGGIAHFVNRLSLGLGSRGHEVHLFTFSRQYPGFLFPGTSQTAEAAEDAETAVDAALNDPDPVALRTIDSINPFSWAKTGRQIAALDPDVVVINYWLSFFSPAYRRIARIIKRSGCPVLIIAHNAIPHEPRLGDSILARYFFTVADGVIALSRTVKDDLVKTIRVTAPIDVAPHPVYDNFGAAIDRESARAILKLSPRPTLLFFGFVRRYKGLDVLLNALPAMLQKMPELQLVVAGEFYEEEQTYRNLVTQLGISSSVRFDSEYIPDAKVPAYFCAADLVVQPYRSATQSGVAQIAFQYERPIIVTDVGGLAEIVPNDRAGYVVPPENPPMLADAVIRFFEEDRAAEMTLAVREQKEKYSWDRFCETLEGMANRVIVSLTNGI